MNVQKAQEEQAENPLKKSKHPVAEKGTSRHKNNKYNFMASELNVAKLMTVIGFLETKELYAETKSKTEFTQTVLKEMGKSPIEKTMQSFFDYLYDAHEKTNNPNFIWVHENGDNYNNLKKAAIKHIKPGTKKEGILKTLFPLSPIHKDPPQLIRPRNGWWNLLLKIGTLLADEFA